MSQIINYLFVAEKESLSPIRITQTCSDSKIHVGDQLNSLLELIIPSNISKFINQEQTTTLPLYINQTNNALFPMKYIAGMEQVSLTSCYLFTKSVCLGNKVISISLITTLTVFQIFTPLLSHLLHELQKTGFDRESIDVVYRNLNGLKLDLLMNHFKQLNMASKFSITRLQPDFSSNESLKLPDDLTDYFTDHGNFYKTSIEISKTSIFEFPIQIPKSSVIASPMSMFGIDLQRSRGIKDMINILNETKVDMKRHDPIAPYTNIEPIHVLLNALMLNKKVAIFSTNGSYNLLGDIVQTLYLIFNAVFSSTSSLLFYPTIDVVNVDLIKFENSFLIGTLDSRIASELDLDVWFDLDAKLISIKGTDTSNLISFVDEDVASSYDFMPYSIQKGDKLTNWKPSIFPEIIKDKDYSDAFLLTEYYNTEDNFKFPKTKSCKPSVDSKLDNKLRQLIKKHHDDQTLFVVITNYLRELSSKVLPAFYHYIMVSQLKDHRAKIVSENLAITREELEKQIISYIQVNHIIQPFPINYSFDSTISFLEDPDIYNFYLHIVDSNTSLLELAIMYNSNAFTHSNVIPGFLFAWETELGIVDIRLDTHYLISILDTLIDETSNNCWGLKNHLLLQLFKSINAILKTHGTGMDGLTDVLMDLFIENEIDEDSPIINGSTSSLSIISGLSALKVKSSSNVDSLEKIGKLGKKRFSKLVLIASLYISIDGPQDIVQTKKGLRRKDLLLTEFKRFLSTVLNDNFFKEYVFAELDDYVKLMVNDFIDFHM